MEYLFNKATVFNSDLFWNTLKVTSMEGLFRETLIFDRDISIWNTFKVKKMNVS